jgi:thiol-disulfide isomerase/thioredoxin
MRPGAPRAGKSDANGQLVFPEASVFDIRRDDSRNKAQLFVLHEERRLGAIIDLTPADMAEPVEVTLEPLCFVRGKVDCPEMEAEGHVMKKITAWVDPPTPGTEPVAMSESDKQRFGMLLPAGTYELQMGAIATDGATYSRLTQEVTVEKGQEQLDLGTLHFESSRLSQLLGKPAPELSGIIEWRNGSPLTMEQLRGKVVVLDFWSYACSICIAHMPELFAVQKKYKNNDDLVIIAVHSGIANTLDEAFEKCEKMRRKIWRGEDFPFRVALDTNDGFMKALGIRGVPTLLVVDRDGNLARRFYTADDPGFRDEIARLLNTPPKSENPSPTTRSTATTKDAPGIPGLAKPESALRGFLAAQRKGDTAAYKKCVSGKVLEGMEALAKANDEALRIDAVDYFTKLTVLDVKVDETIAIINAKVVYNRKWLDAHNKDLRSLETAAGEPAGVFEFKLLPEQGEMQWEDPIAAANGEGFGAFVMMREADGWKFHLGYLTDKQANLKKVTDAFAKKSSALEKPPETPPAAETRPGRGARATGPRPAVSRPAE